jgi:hypothetical protein
MKPPQIAIFICLVLPAIVSADSRIERSFIMHEPLSATVDLWTFRCTLGSDYPPLCSLRTTDGSGSEIRWNMTRSAFAYRRAYKINFVSRAVDDTQLSVSMVVEVSGATIDISDVTGELTTTAGLRLMYECESRLPETVVANDQQCNSP